MFVTVGMCEQAVAAFTRVSYSIGCYSAFIL